MLNMANLCSSFQDSSYPIDALLLIFALTEMIVDIVQAAFCCGVACCCTTPPASVRNLAAISDLACLWKWIISKTVLSWPKCIHIRQEHTHIWTWLNNFLINKINSDSDIFWKFYNWILFMVVIWLYSCSFSNRSPEIDIFFLTKQHWCSWQQ